ncbi:MAG: DUF2914 domain-containing protein [Deltaproteobacteria bacterium]|nr:DUF2914 domain-containing protein [Deltaproteobacteria bacterium]MBN2671034.1 DUF2914 domain-containing protein [Deltaproteobacteria bacterium]
MKTKLFYTTITCLALGVIFGCEPDSAEKASTRGDKAVVTENSPVMVTKTSDNVGAVNDSNVTPSAVGAEEENRAASAKSEKQDAEESDVQSAEEEGSQDEKATEMMNVGESEADAAASVAGNTFAPTINESEDLMLNSIILARGVDKREPVDAGTTFSVSEGEKIYAILDVKNSMEEDATLTVSWKMPGSEKEIGKTDLTAKPAKSWRTWSFTRWAKKAGTWEAIVRNANDEIIARAPFEVTE